MRTTRQASVTTYSFADFRPWPVTCDHNVQRSVHSDLRGNPASSIVDALSTMVVDGDMVKVVSWYDNEWGYSLRTADLCAMLADRGL